MDIIIFLTLYQ